MSDNTINTKSILKNDPAFPDYLDFDTLRREGIGYLAGLSGKIWTDHNVHDPGITMLELLCYVLIDLGYRTTLPIADILSRPPQDNTPDDNFFTPAQILSCNPVTIIDFRKLLIDIQEVKNAWLEIAELEISCGDQTGAFVGPPYRDPVVRDCGNEVCRAFLNGLYKVYIELYKGPYEKKTKKEEEAIDAIVEKVRSVLMAHRNLCEDFVSIQVLCKERIGVCADIELEPDADAEKIYPRIIEALKTFFSPDPKFYTLPELLQKNKPIEEIFAGRPYLPESHGFVDTEELEALPFRKEVHISDVYNALFAVEGVRSVRKLSLKSCDGFKKREEECNWKYRLEKDHVPEFSLDCSGFRFTRNGMPVQVNEKKFKDLFSLNFSFAGKILYSQPFPNLDMPVPKGIYRNDLAEYHSMINDLPRVYGVSEGGLPDSAPKARKAQALQLQGFLLFFDQLLANYLAQLSHIRNLFALKSDQDQQTYFVNKPLDVPGIKQLLRFGDGTDTEIAVGKQGSIQARPVEKSLLEEAAKNNELWKIDPDNTDPISFLTVADRDTRICQAMEDLQNRNFTIHTVYHSNTDCWSFYIYTFSDELAFLGTGSYGTEQEAVTAAANACYVGGFRENYRKYIVPKDKKGKGGPLSPDPRFSFNIELNMAGYFTYLQQIVEDKSLYLERRNTFLDHLLARFAESFTDFALLSYNTLQGQELTIREIQQKEKFLSGYDLISRNRGKAFDYKKNGWNNNNISGYEHRVQALTGMEDLTRHSLCHFELNQYAQQFYWTLPVTDAEAQTFRSPVFFDSAAEAKANLQAFIEALKVEGNYTVVHDPVHDANEIVVLHNNDKVIFPSKIATTEEANNYRQLLYRAFSGNPLPEKDIFVSHEIYKAELKDVEGKVRKRAVQPADTAAKALSAAKPIIKNINGADWENVNEKEKPTEQLDLRTDRSNPRRLIDITRFNKEINPCPDEYRWYLDNEQGELLLKSQHTYPSQQAAIESMAAELTSTPVNSASFKTREQEQYHFFDLLSTDGSVIATSPSFENDEERKKAMDWLEAFCNREKTDRQYTYALKEASRWRVQFGDALVFESVPLLADPENAINTWRKDKAYFRSLTNYVSGNDHILYINDEKGNHVSRFVTTTAQTREEIFNIVQDALTKNEFRVTTVKMETGYGFRVRDAKDNVLLSGYEVYDSRGAAFNAMLRAFEKASQESMYLKSGDDGNRAFTFLLKEDDDNFLAEHPVIYDSPSERDSRFAETLGFFKGHGMPGKAVKDPVQYTFTISKDSKQLFISEQKFRSKRDADEATNQILLLAALPGNWQLTRDSEKDPFEVRLVTGGQWYATAPEKFNTPALAASVRDRIIATIQPAIYTLDATPFPDKWQFHYYLGLDPASYTRSTSNTDYNSEAEAIEAYKKLSVDLGGMQVQKTGTELQLSPKQKGSNQILTSTIIRNQEQPAITPDEQKQVSGQLSVNQRLRKLIAPESDKELDKLVKMDDLTQQGTWVYRLVKKDGFFAWHRECDPNRGGLDPTQQIKELYEALRNPLHYLEICQGGDITCVRKDPSTRNISYHYEVKARNLYYDPVSKEEVVLFKSCVGYSSVEEAEKAFTSNYLTILKRASKAIHYGIGQYISLTPQFIKPEQVKLNAGQPVVYMPTKTIDHFGGEAQAIAMLVELAKSYPVRLSGRDHYRFSLYDYQEKRSYFVGAQQYDSAAAAMQAFYFLLVLKKNRQNYYWYCDKDTGRKFIVLKEVLAENYGRFHKPEEAWAGIDQFIGTTQTEQSFHLYVNNSDCCYSFFVACKSKLIHPCTYDTIPLRDKAARKLRETFANYQLPPLPVLTLDSSGSWYDVMYNGKFVTKLAANLENEKQGDGCYGPLLDLLELVQQKPEPSFNKKDQQYVFQDKDDRILAYLEKGRTKEEWIKALVDLALRFPLFRKDDAFYFRLPYLPANGEWTVDASLHDDCGCGGKKPDDNQDCHIAWIGGCYTTCREALDAYLATAKQLQNEKNYRFVFDCTCGKYRIEWIEEKDIIAVNPQCYTTPEMVCAAVERAKALINDEGIFVVEHILLRPHCPEDCHCLLPASPDPHCCFTWPLEKDPCLETKPPICFTPGADPYSFIATVVLPAWPRRFRDKANRKLVETILYREAPAHVLLRVLWLSPKDLCTFETLYRSWTRWLANKKDACSEGFDPCVFIRFLFNSRLSCWEPGTWCGPCLQPGVQDNPCGLLEEADPKCVLTVGDVYGWEALDCCDDNPRLPVPGTLEKERVKLIRKRNAQYKKQLDTIAEALPRNKVIGQAVSYIAGNTADETKMLQITNALTKNMAAGSSPDQKKLFSEALNTVMSFYLDRTLLDQYDPDKLSEVKRNIRKASFTASGGAAALQAWNTADLGSFVHPKAALALTNLVNMKK